MCPPPPPKTPKLSPLLLAELLPQVGGEGVSGLGGGSPPEGEDAPDRITGREEAANLPRGGRQPVGVFWGGGGGEEVFFQLG